MSLVSSNKVSENRTELVIEIKGEQFTKAVDASFKKNAKTIALPGFRKGKAPRGMIERAYGTGMFYDDAINELYPEAYKAAIDELGLEPVDVADVEVVDVDATGFTFKAGVTTRPEVTLGEYKGLSVERDSIEVTQEEIDKELDASREKFARISPVEDRPAKNGDMSIINFEGFVEDVAFDGGKGEDYQLTLGSNTFIPGFEDQIIGHSIDEEFDVNVTFPEQYGEESLAGKPAVFKVKLLELKEKILPELDDEFAKDASEFDTFAEFKEQIKSTFALAKEKEAEEAYESRLIEKIVEGITVIVPECMYEDRVKEMANDFAMRLQQQGLKIDDFIKYTGDSMEKFLESFKPQAETQVKTRLTLEAVAKAENLSATEEEVDAEYVKLAAQFKTEVEELKKFISAKDITGDISCRKAIAFVTENAVSEEVVKTAEKKPRAKKAAADTTEKKPKAKKAATSEETE